MDETAYLVLQQLLKSIKLQWASRIARMGETNMHKNVLFVNLKGRSRSRWEDNIEMCLKCMVRGCGLNSSGLQFGRARSY